ncbi:MAG: uracil-DNA glycosylase [Myxococcota bacterium]
MTDADARDELSELVEGVAELLRWELIVGSTEVAGLPPESSEAGPATAGAGPETDPETTTGASDEGPRRDMGGGAEARLLRLAEEAAACTRCELHRGRTRSVFARGNRAAEIVFVGEGPGYHEDQQGLPFVGKAGQLLDRMIGAMGYGRDEVYICNVVKCRPPDNRTPKPDEAAACAPFLQGQLEVVAPRVIVTLGRCAAENLGCADPAGGRWRGQWGSYAGIPVMPTYHPAYLLRNPEQKRPVWEDLQKVMGHLGKTR